MTSRPNLVRSRPATLASGTPISVCNSTTSEARPGPNCTAAAPSASDVWRRCRPCTAGLIELFLEVFAASLPAVSVAGGAVQVPGGAVQVAGGAVQVAGGAVQVAGGAVQVPGGAVQVPGGAVQIVDQLGVLPLKLLDALVPRILLSPRRPRTVAPAVLAGHAPCIGTCAPTLHTTSRIFSTLPANQRPRAQLALACLPPPAPPSWVSTRRWSWACIRAPRSSVEPSSGGRTHLPRVLDIDIGRGPAQPFGAEGERPPLEPNIADAIAGDECSRSRAP